MNTSCLTGKRFCQTAISIAGLFFLTTLSVVAQQSPEPKETPPPGPLIQKRAEDFSCWTVTQKLSNAQSSPSSTSASGKEKDGDGALQTTSFVKTGDILRTVIVDSQHRTWNVWVKSGMQVVIWPDQKSVGFVAKPGSSSDYNPLYVNLSASDFPGFEWISADNYAGIRTVFGKRCLVFSDKVKGAANGSKDNGIISASVATVDFDSRLPVSLTNGFGMFLYKFLPPPTEMQTLPEPVLTYIDNERRKAQALTRLPGTPY